VNRRTLLQALTLHGTAAAAANPTVRFALAMAVDPPADPHGTPAAVDPFAAVSSKKGLQVQMTDDAIALGVRHAGLNVNLCDLIAPAAAAPDDTIVHQHDGGEGTHGQHRTHGARVEAVDAAANQRIDKGVEQARHEQHGAEQGDGHAQHAGVVMGHDDIQGQCHEGQGQTQQAIAQAVGNADDRMSLRAGVHGRVVPAIRA
jgi:hypothetical protein